MRHATACWLTLALASASGPIGIDVGTVNSVTAAPRRGGVDVLVNEASRRQTPSIVAFDEQQRLLGQSATSQCVSSPENSVAEVKSLLGIDADAAEKLVPHPSAALTGGDDDEVRLALRVRGAEQRFSATQLFAMLLHKLHRCAEHELGAPPAECTLAVPLHYGPARRRAVLDAAAIAGLRSVRLISDGAAVALDYALGRDDLSADKDRHVLFVDAGHSGVQACVVRLRKDSLQLLSHVYAADVGGAVRVARQMPSSRPPRAPMRRERRARARAPMAADDDI